MITIFSFQTLAFIYQYEVEVVDLGDQPFANSLKNTQNEALNLKKHPLKLVWCPVCNHMHLSHVADREELFEDYIYVSSTTKTLSDYFDWLSDKVRAMLTVNNIVFGLR